MDNITISDTANVSESAILNVASTAQLTIGEHVTIGDGVKIVASSGYVYIGDWSTLHDNTLVLCTEYVTIGQHCWFGQSCVIDGTGGLKIGNGVRVGMFSQLWTHVAAGEQIEGCSLFGMLPSVIENDVWLVGTCTVGSGVTIGEKSICLAHSNVLRDIPPGVVAAGSPAKPKDGLNFYKKISLEEKWVLLKNWLEEYANERAEFFNATDDSLEIGGGVRFFRTSDGYCTADDQKCSFDLERKKYKNLNDEGISLIRYLSGNKARFYEDEE